MSAIDEGLFRRALEAAPIGVVLVDAADPAHPVLYANRAFEALCGFPAAELIGRNLRMLQVGDRDQDARHRLREALERREPCRVLMRNCRKDGTLFWNDITVIPLHDANGGLRYYAGYYRDASERLKSQSQGTRDPPPAAPAPAAAREDRLTGLYTQAAFEALLKREWAVAQRERRSIAAFCIDIDALDAYNATFGRAAGDSAIRRVGHCIAGCLRRASDVVARGDGGSMRAFAPGVAAEQAMRIAQTMTERVRDLRIHHPRSSVLRYMSVSVGSAAVVPESSEQQPASLLQRAQGQLTVAKQGGRNRAS
ncbi:MAG TPA: diguanylate cyclase [Steroidobacteraceae bacterium]|nr:diguanylate cyclase [Steroidobacteraceae bacterium]